MIKNNAKQIDIQLKKIISGFTELEKQQAPFAASVAMNKTVYETSQFLRSAANRAYQGGATRFSQSGFVYSKSDKKNLVATVYIADRQSYLLNTIDGGVVKPVKRALVQPVEINKNKYGNIPRGKIRRLITNKKRYFSGTPRNWGVDSNEKYAGVWERKNKNTQLVMLAKYKNQRHQTKFFPSREIAYKYAKQRFMKHFIPALDNAILTAFT
tara:strand:+ start:271 stop:906 length:636 start_codon:yes stop_codon:yes gene_type:complete